jgi:hypothetical protein
MSMKNHFDERGNYINSENLSLADIYHRGFADGVESGTIPTAHVEFKDISWLCSKCNSVISGYGDEEWVLSKNKYCYCCGSRFVKEV